VSVITRQAVRGVRTAFDFSLRAGLLANGRRVRVRLVLRSMSKAWLKACALGLSTTYTALFLLTSLCLATGFLHAEVPHDHPHHHAHSDADQPSVLPDICDFVIQALMTTELQTGRFPSRVLPPGDVLALAPARLISPTPMLSHTIRAPPAS
jgi:hypothetical protein